MKRTQLSSSPRHSKLNKVGTKTNNSDATEKARIAREVWARIEAFLSLKSPHTHRTYRGILAEWCEFIGITDRSVSSAMKFLSATDLDAISYRSWLFGKEGQKPRTAHLKKPHQSGLSKRAKSPKPSLAKTKLSRCLTEESYSGNSEVREAASNSGKAGIVECAATEDSGGLPLSTRRTKYSANTGKLRDGTQLTLTNSTVNKKLTALRRMYRTLENIEGLAIPNPFNVDRVPPPAPNAGRKRPTKMVDFDLVLKMIESPIGSEPKAIRDRAILAVLFGGGLRRGEAAKLRISDVLTSQAGTCYLRLRSTKAKTDADQAIPPWAERYLKDLLLSRGEQGAAEDDFLFISFTGPGGTTPTRRAISPSSIYNIFKASAARVGAEDFITPHSARATAITKLLTDGVPYREVRQFSRHSSVQMVEVYDKRRLTVDENPGRRLSFAKDD